MNCGNLDPDSHWEEDGEIQSPEDEGKPWEYGGPDAREEGAIEYNCFCTEKDERIAELELALARVEKLCRSRSVTWDNGDGDPFRVVHVHQVRRILKKVRKG